jgi:hypothetical protein
MRTAWITLADYHASPDEAARVAVGHVLDEARRSHTEPGVVATDLDPLRQGPPALVAFAKTYPRATPKLRGLPGGSRPVLAWAPDYETLSLATAATGGSLLVVVETAMPSLLGWAMHTQAVDLTTMSVTVDTRSAAVLADLERLKWAGNNGWTDEAGKQQAEQTLQSLAERKELDRDVVLGTLLAMGVHHKNLTRLDKLIAARS